jgi:hypothetical protein
MSPGWLLWRRSRLPRKRRRRSKRGKFDLCPKGNRVRRLATCGKTLVLGEAVNRLDARRRRWKVR